jgi:hypothetical protein
VNHSRTRARLSEYLDRTLAPEQRSKVDAHLVECAACSAELRELERTVNLLRGLPDPEPPPYLAQTVMARLEAGEGQRGSLAQQLRRLIDPAFAAPVAAALGGLLLFTLVDIEIGRPTGNTVSDAPIVVASPSSNDPQPERVVARQRDSRVHYFTQPDASAEVAHRLRGAGHPHSMLLATHIEGESDFMLVTGW